MRKQFGGVAAIALLVLGLGAVSAADAGTGKIHAQVRGTVKIDKDDASVGYVTAKYVCQGGDEESHLWVSVKQTADRKPHRELREEGSSGIAAAWIQSHPVPGEGFTCDGDWHTSTFRIDTAEQGFGELKQGQAWIQFCLFGGDGQAKFAQRFGEVK